MRPRREGGRPRPANTYDGDGGVPIGGIFNKALYAFKFAEPNIVLSNRVNDDSKILYDRARATGSRRSLRG